MTNQQKLNKLCNIRTDLGDDYSAITTINNHIQSVADNYVSLVSSSQSNIVKGKIEDLKEPSQTNDGLIVNAKSYCQYEINRVCKEIDAEGK